MSISFERTKLEKIIAALLAFAKNEDKASSTVGTNDAMFLTFSLNKVPPPTYTRPKAVKTPHSVYVTPQICLIVKDADAEAASALVRDGVVTRVVTGRELSQKYSQYKDQRELERSFDVFFADGAMHGVLPKLLGKTFISRSKFPILINTRTEESRRVNNFSADLTAAEIARNLSSAQFRMPTAGVTGSFRIGSVNMTPAQLADNIEMVVESVAEHHLDGMTFTNLHIKTANSAALPIFGQ